MQISILLTLYNEEKGLPRVLKYLTGHSQFFSEIVAVSDGCHDHTDEILCKWIDESTYYPKTLITRKERYGRGNAIALGLSNCQNDVCIILAGDIQPFRDSLHNLATYFHDGKIGAVTGHPVLLNDKRTIGDCLSHIMWMSHNRVGEITTQQGDFFHLNGEMYGIRKSALPTVNYNVMNEDSMIGYLVKRNGYTVLWAKDVQYYMRYPSGFWEWLKIRKRSCYGRIELIRRTGLDHYAFHELKHRDYVLNVFKIALSNPKFLASLCLGVPCEFLLRLYYQTIDRDTDNPLSDLWQPATQTKW